MLVLAMYLKRKSHKHGLMAKSLLNGFELLGYDTDVIELSDNELTNGVMLRYKKMHPSITVSVGWKSNMRQLVKFLNTKHFSIFDPPIRPTSFHRSVSDNYWGIGFKRPHGDYRYSEALPPDRWEKLKEYYNIKVKPWSSGSDIVIAHQPNRGFDGEIRYPFYDNIISECLKTNRKVIICTSPVKGGKELLDKYRNKWTDMGCKFKVGIDGNLDNAYCFISSGGTTASKAIFSGVPVFGGELNITNPIFPLNTNIKEFLKNPPKPNRIPWFNWIAYQEWTIDEMSNGEALNYLSKLYGV
jgi:hypothetical protein